MRELFFSISLFLLCPAVFSQEKADSATYKYCDVVSVVNMAGKMYSIIVDSGQVTKGNRLTGQYKDASGHAYIFNTPMDGINFMAMKQWAIQSVYYDGSAPHFIMRKRCK